MLRRIQALVIKELLSVLRDKKTRMLLLMPPILMLVLFANAVTLEVKNVNIGILNLDQGAESRDLIRRIEGSPTFKHVFFLRGVSQIRNLVDSEKALVVLHIGQDFSKRILSNQSAKVQVILDGRRLNAAQIVQGYISRILIQFNQDLAAHNPKIPRPASTLVARHWFNPNLDYVWFTVPSLVGILTMTITSNVTALSVARERELGTFDQLLVSPLQPLEILIGKTIPAIIFGVFEGTLMIVAGVFIFKIPFTGSIPVALYEYAGIFTFHYRHWSIYFFTGKDAAASSFRSFMFSNPAITLSGYAAPIENMPQWLQTVTYINPLRYFMVILKGSFLKNMPADVIFANTWPLALIALFNLEWGGLVLQKEIGMMLKKGLSMACGLSIGLAMMAPTSWAIRLKVGPDYREPQVSAPADWGDTLQSKISLKDPMIVWWGQFNDPLLNRLIEDAIRINYNLQVAVARVRETRALESAAVGRLLPLITSTSGYSRNRFSDNGTNPVGRFAQMSQNAAPAAPGAPQPFNLGINNPTNDFRTGFDATWELDVFGYRRWQLEAARDRIQASVENRRNVTISVISEVARQYVELRQAQTRLAIQQKNIDLQQQSLNLTSQRYHIGLAPRQDTTQAATQLETYRASLPLLQATLEISAHALAILTGRDPNNLLGELSAAQSVPAAQPVVGLGLPASLLLRRPDIRQAERELAATSADISAARAQLYPTIRFTGSWGWEAIRIQDLYKWSSRYWSLNPTINWPVFQRRELRSNVKVAQARYAQQEAQFRQSILTALADVQDAVSTLDSARAQHRDLAAAVAQNEQTVQLTTALYKEGLNNYLSVLDAERNLVNLQDRLAQSEAATTLQTIRLYKALGGGWEVF